GPDAGLGGGHERDEDHDEHEGEEQLAEREPRVDVVAHEPLLRASVACTQVAVIAARHALSGFLLLAAHLRLHFLLRLLAVFRNERTEVGGLALAPLGGRALLAVAGLLRGGGLAHGWVPPGTTPMRVSRSMAAAHRAGRGCGRLRKR